jgi:hypothetical protein
MNHPDPIVYHLCNLFVLVMLVLFVWTMMIRVWP